MDTAWADAARVCVCVCVCVQACADDKDSGHVASAIDMYFMQQVRCLLDAIRMSESHTQAIAAQFEWPSKTAHMTWQSAGLLQ